MLFVSALRVATANCQQRVVIGDRSLWKGCRLFAWGCRNNGALIAINWSLVSLQGACVAPRRRKTFYEIKRKEGKERKKVCEEGERLTLGVMRSRNYEKQRST